MGEKTSRIAREEPESCILDGQVPGLKDKSGISDIPLHRCPDLVIKTDTPKGIFPVRLS